jgi:hypothetical protein
LKKMLMIKKMTNKKELMLFFFATCLDKLIMK